MKIMARTILVSTILVSTLIGNTNADKMLLTKETPREKETKSRFFKTAIPHWLDQEALRMSWENYHKEGQFSKTFSLSKNMNATQQETLSIETQVPNRKTSLLSVYLGVGVNHIGGGDLNRNVRDTNARYEAWNSIGLANPYNNVIKWDEIKWIPNWKGELILNVFRRISLGIGIEYLTQSNQGYLAFAHIRKSGSAESGNENTFVFTITNQLEHKLTVLPITLNLYYSIPLNRFADVFFSVGIGYYIGKIRYNSYSPLHEFDILDFFDSAGGLTDSVRIERYDYLTQEYEAQNNTIGFQGGLGLDLKLSSAFSFIIEGNFRIVNFKDWEASRNAVSEIDEIWELPGGTILYDDSITDTTNQDGNLWFLERLDSNLDKWYGSFGFFEEQPEPSEWQRNIRKGELDFNGFALKVGVRFRF
jgi:opacity protein-like surface antigen